MPEYAFEAELWEYDGPAAWYFVSLPAPVADEIEAHHASGAGFGSVRVEVTVGATTWRTSLFPDTGRATYLLPMKRAVRTAERLDVGTSVSVRLRPTGE